MSASVFRSGIELDIEEEEPETDALIREGAEDYALHPEADLVWITVGTASVYVKRADGGVVVDVYPLG